MYQWNKRQQVKEGLSPFYTFGPQAEKKVTHPKSHVRNLTSQSVTRRDKATSFRSKVSKKFSIFECYTNFFESCPGSCLTPTAPYLLVAGEVSQGWPVPSVGGVVACGCLRCHAALSHQRLLTSLTFPR